MTLSRTDLGRRIAGARERARLSQAQLAELVGLTQSAVSRIESGARGVDSLELAAIADALDISVIDLLESHPLAEELRLAARQQDVRPSAAFEQALSRVVDLVRLDRLLRDLPGAPAPFSPAVAIGDLIREEILRDLPGAAGPPPAVPPQRRVSAARQGAELAAQVRRDWGLDDDPLPNLFDLLEDRSGLAIVLEPLQEGVDGLCARTDGVALALIDSSVIYGRQRFTAAHELCHFLAGDVGTLLVDEKLFQQDDDKERRASSFAAYFLMPRKGIVRYLRDRKVDGKVVTELQYTFGVSLDALLWHLLNLRLVSEDERERLLAVGAKALAFRHGYGTEWERIEGQRGLRRPPRRLLSRALEAYGEGWIGIEPLADLLGRRDADALRRELEDHGIGYDVRWWEATAPA